MGIAFWIQFIVQIVIAITLIGYMLKVEDARPTEEINPKNVEDLNEL